MAEEKTKIDVSDESAEEAVVIDGQEKQTAFDGPMAIKPDDLTDSVINDIARSEVDEAIQAEDEKVLEAINTKPTFKEKFSKWFHSWWDVPKKRYTVLGCTAGFLLVFFTVPVTRYAFLNTVGVRASANIIVLDESTNQPLKNVDVIIRGQTVQTDIDGKATFEKIKLGSTNIEVKKIAYADTSFKQTIGLGGNALESAKLKPIGSQFTFEIKDWLSDKPINRAEVSYMGSSALSDEEGKATLTIESTDETEIEVTITAQDYREQKYMVDATSTETNQVKMKAGQADYFISNRDGKYNVYKIYPDEDPSIIVAGTGTERDDMRFAVSPDRKYAVLSSTRDGNRNGDGYLMSDLYLINLDSNELSKIDMSERVDLVGWVNNKLVYVKIAEGASGKNPHRHRLQILNPESKENKEIAASNYFNDIAVTGNKIYYAPSDAYKDNPDTSLFVSDADGNINKIYDAEVWTIIQTNQNELVFDATGEWFRYTISDNYSSALDGAPTEKTSKIFIESPDGKTSLWVDQRDGKGVLLAKESDQNEDKTLWTQSGLKYPVQWLDNKHIVFRVATPDETADYIINIDGGDAKKLTDVSNVAGIDRWYYY